jgi:hypothetical protein
MAINRRIMTLGGLATVCHCFASNARTSASYGGCVYSELADRPSADSQTVSDEFPGLRRGVDQTEIALGPIIVEMFQLFELTPATAFYDDSKTCNGNAGADPRPLLPTIPNLPLKYDGTIVLGTKLLNMLGRYEHQTAAIAAVCAHEFGHILQFKYVDAELKRIRDAEDSVVRTELFADFICGYHAGIRKLRQEEYPAAIQALNQFRAGDQIHGSEHHGTPEERARSVGEGFIVGSAGRVSPETIARLGLQYVKSLTLQAVHAAPGCENVDTGINR